MMERESKENILADFLINASPLQLIRFIEELEKPDNLHDFALRIKPHIFALIMQLLKVHHHVFRSPNSKRYKTELYIRSETDCIVLFLGKKDSQNPDVAYARLFDMHKTELIEFYHARMKLEAKLEISNVINDTDGLSENLKDRIGNFISKLDERSKSLAQEVSP